MRCIVASNYEDMSRKAADMIAKQIQMKPTCRLGLATGSTPLGTYANLVADYQRGAISFADVTTFNLDEYRGLDGTHQQSYRYFMNKHLFDLVDIDKNRTHVPDGSNDDAHAVCINYEQDIDAAGGIDLQLLGIGHNGHIGFNEPDDAFPVLTHLVDLTQSTITANSRLFDSTEEVPRQAYTMGIGTIMKARKVLLIASGADKARIIADAVAGPVTPQVPASILQLHPHATVLIDKEAAALIADSPVAAH
ncbi:glucosamine-6-phosphate deaminase [Cryptobacterium curtum]